MSDPAISCIHCGVVQTHRVCADCFNDPDHALAQQLRSTLDLPTIQSLRYLFDAFIEGGYAEDADDEFHLDAIFRWFESVAGSGREEA